MGKLNIPVGAAIAAAAIQVSQAGLPAPNAPHSSIARPSRAATAQMDATIRRISKGRARVLRLFPGPKASGLQGVVLATASGSFIAYATANGKYVLSGNLVGADGTNYSERAAQRYLPPPPPSAHAAKNYADRTHTTSFVWGRAGAPKSMWVVIDPNCIYCNVFFNEIRPYVDTGRLKLHVIMVGVIKPDSLGKSAAILSASDPAEALAADESKFDKADEEGGIAPVLNNAPALEMVKANNAWMREHRIAGTPYAMYAYSSGQIASSSGMPANLGAIIKALALPQR
jgi:thiol:disulfide interchange protein DsbG